MMLIFLAGVQTGVVLAAVAIGVTFYLYRSR